VTVTADDLDAAVSTMVAALRVATDRDWAAVPADAVETDCWHAGEHVGDVLVSYAGQLVAQPDGRYVKFLASADADASAAQILEFAEAGGRILASTVRTASPGVRAWHPTGMADPAGFAGMGCVEALIHGEDIARGLGLALDPPREVCVAVLARMFPAVEVGGADPWRVLLWATGRADLPGRDRVGPDWQWHGAPLAP
jgi:hypothetical protein